MLERLGVQNEWRDKSKLAFAKLQKLLDPSYKFEFADPRHAPATAHAPPPPPPPAPRPPTAPGAAPAPDRARRPIRDPKDQALARDRARAARFCSDIAPARRARRPAADLARTRPASPIVA